MIDEFFELVRISSESLHCGRIAGYLKDIFRNEFGVEPLEQKDGELLNLVVRIPGAASSGRGKPPILLAAHMDTVSPGTDVRPVLVKDRISAESDTVLGADDKSAIDVYLQALRLAKEHGIPLRPLEFVFTDGEEMGLLGAKKLDYGLLTAKEGLCFDSNGAAGTIITAAPTYDKYRIEVVGRAAHSGIEPEKGLSAIKMTAEIVRKIPTGRLDPETTANIGTIRGGRQDNIVPEDCFITGEVRSLAKAKTGRYLKTIRTAARAAAKKQGGRVIMETEREFDGFFFGENDPFLRSVVRAMKSTGLETVLMKSNGGSDANIFNAAGIRTLNCGIGMNNVHTKKENIRVRDLTDVLRFLVRYISLDETEVECE